MPTWRQAADLGAARAAHQAPPALRRGGRRTDRHLPAGGHPPLGHPVHRSRRLPRRYLSALLAKARTRSAGVKESSWAIVGRYFGRTFPAALYAMRWWWLSVLIVSFVGMFAMTWWFLDHPSTETAFGSPADIQRLVDNDFANYYTENAATSFALRVWTNNFWLAATCIAFGVFGFPIVMVVWSNILNVAVTASIMIRHGRADVFFGLITPHGLLEMTCLFVSAGVGLRVFWSWIAPGPKTRMQSLAEQGRAAIGIALGLVVLLLITGLIEAFVTPSGLPRGTCRDRRVRLGGILRLCVHRRPVGLQRRRARRHPRSRPR